MKTRTKNRTQNPKSLFRVLAILLAVALGTSACSLETTNQSGATGSSGQADILDAVGVEVEKPEPDNTAIEPNNNVRIGTLENGMTYYVQSNPTPEKGLSLRLAVNAGSMQQDAIDSGAAHFLEHMMFNGTEKYPGNELTKELERLGVQFGADSNAYTSQDETVYELDLPDATGSNADTALDIMAEWASAATLTEKNTIGERGVVREEARLHREGIGAQYGEAVVAAMQAGTGYENSDPLGSDENILATTPDQLRTFYDRWYRPDNMAIIAVGDLPVDELEAKIYEHFSSATSRGDNQERVEASASGERTETVRVVADPTMPTSAATLTYPISTWDPGTVGGERLGITQQIYGAILMSRLQALADDVESGISQPYAFASPVNRTNSVVQIGFEGSNLAMASALAREEITGGVSAGFSDADVEQATATLQSQFDQILAESETEEHFDITNSYVSHFLSGTPISSAEDSHARVTAILESITAEEVTELFRWDMSNSAHQLIVGGPNAEELPSEDELSKAFARGLVLDPEAIEANKGTNIEQLMSTPSPVKPVETAPLEGFENGTQITYENGLTVNFVPSQTEAGKVGFMAIGPGGFGGLELADGAVFGESVEAVASSGAGENSRTDHRRFIDKTTAELFPLFNDTLHGFGGQSGTDDLEVLMQNFHLAIASPRVDEAALAEVKSNAETTSSAVELDASWAAGNEIAKILHDNDERFDYSPSATLSQLTADKALDIYKSRYNGVDGWTVNLTGDVDGAQVEKLASLYLGTLPVGSPVEPVDSRPEILTEVDRRTLTSNGNAEAAGAVGLAYQIPREVDNKTRIELMVMDGILNDRLFTEGREELGATYGGYAYSYAEAEPTNRVSVVFESTGDPSRTEELLDVMLDAADTLAADGPTADEFERAKAVVEADFDAEPSNEDMITMMPVAMDDSEPITPELRTELLSQVTAEDIEELAQELFDQPARAEVLVRP